VQRKKRENWIMPLKDPKFRKIPLKAHEIEKYH
jgi:hypothetical protein